MRTLLVTLHRWAGLATALFLFIAGATGAVISWDHEIDEWLNPQLFEAHTPGTPLPVAELARRIEAADPRVRVTFMPLQTEPGHAFTASVQPRIDPASGAPFEPGYNQVALDPVSGAIQGRASGARCRSRARTCCPSSTSCTTRCTSPTASASSWACGSWASSASSGCSTR
jgi:uncharacterized iron-regulated membrane protein